MLHPGRKEPVVEIQKSVFLEGPRPYGGSWQSIVRERMLFLHLASPEMARVVFFERAHYIPCRSFIQYEASPERRRRGASHGRRDGAMDQKQRRLLSVSLGFLPDAGIAEFAWSAEMKGTNRRCCLGSLFCCLPFSALAPAALLPFVPSFAPPRTAAALALDTCGRLRHAPRTSFHSQETQCPLPH